MCQRSSSCPPKCSKDRCCSPCRPRCCRSREPGCCFPCRACCGGPCGGPCSGPCCGSTCCGQAPCGMLSYRLVSGPCGPVQPCMEFRGCCQCGCSPPFYYAPNRCKCCWEWGCFGPFY